MDGIILVDKPKGWTSHDVVDYIRKKFSIKKVGHTGTLDPMATGLLIVLLGRMTKAAKDFSNDDKEYEGTLTLGVVTDTADSDGKVLSSKPVPELSKADVEAYLKEFEGELLQVPPMVSAVRFKGKKLYELARSGINVERPARKIFIKSLQLTQMALPNIKFNVSCSKGTYIRTLCEDIGARIGCGGHTSSIRRVRCGKYHVKDAVALETVKAILPGELSKIVIR